MPYLVIEVCKTRTNRLETRPGPGQRYSVALHFEYIPNKGGFPVLARSVSQRAASTRRRFVSVLALAGNSSKFRTIFSSLRVVVIINQSLNGSKME